jgi:hypothetical protein
MMQATTKSAARRFPSQASPYTQYGIPLGKAALRALEKRGIYCQTSISVEHQHLAKRYVLRGVESGGAVSDMGRYCAFLNLDGAPIPWLQSIDSISGNGRHAVVVAPELIRLEMFRVRRTYELAITRHALQAKNGQNKPVIASSLLFRGREGTLSLDLQDKENRSLRGKVAPTFFSESGELREIPSSFDEAIKIVTTALNTVVCKRAHIALPSRVPLLHSSH